MFSYNKSQVSGPKDKPGDPKKSAETEHKENTIPEDLSTPIVNEQEQSQTINNENAFYKESASEVPEQQSAVEKSAEKISESDQSDIIEGDDSVGDQNTIINP